MKRLKTILIAASLLFSVNTNIFAATFNVSNTPQFRQALEDATVNGQDDTIILSVGVYKTTDDGLGTLEFSDTEVYDLTIKASDGLTYNDVILDGDNTHQVINLNSTEDSTVTLSGISVVNASGGGVYSEIDLILIRSNVSSNTASSHGGGIYASQSLTVTNSTISGNTSKVYGGGIYTGRNTSLTVTNSTISGNTASSSGGGIYTGIRTSLTVSNSTISGNTAISGGGGIYAKASLTVTNSTISGNTTGSNGGGISGKGLFINNIFNENSTDIYFKGDSSVYNNYIDYTKLENESINVITKKNNIQPRAGVPDFVDADFRIGVNSIAIDKGLNPNSQTFKDLFTNAETLATVQAALQTDKDGRQRITGPAIDLGAYEYGAGVIVPITCNIMANGSDGPLTVNQGDLLTVTVSLTPGSYSGEKADWWVVADTPSGLQSYDLNQGFVSGLSVTYQGLVFNLGLATVLNTSGLAAGAYTYYFGVDLEQDGELDMTEGVLYYDSVVVNVQ